MTTGNFWLLGFCGEKEINELQMKKERFPLYCAAE